MTIIMIEATAEELSANRTIMDNLNNVLNTFANRLCGVNNLDYSAIFSNCNERIGDNEE